MLLGTYFLRLVHTNGSPAGKDAKRGGDGTSRAMWQPDRTQILGTGAQRARSLQQESRLR